MQMIKTINLVYAEKSIEEVKDIWELIYAEKGYGKFMLKKDIDKESFNFKPSVIQSS